MLGPGNELSPPPHCARLSAFHHFQSIKQPAARESCRWVTSQHLTSFRRWGEGKKSTFLIGDINNAEEEITLKGFSFPKWTCRMWLPSWAAVRRSSSGSQGGNSERVTLRREVLCRVRDTADPAVRMHCSPQEQGRCGRSFTVLPEALGVTTNQRGQTLGVHPGGKAPHLQRSSPRSRKAAEAPLLPRASQTAFSILCPLGGIQEDCSVLCLPSSASTRGKVKGIKSLSFLPNLQNLLRALWQEQKGPCLLASGSLHRVAPRAGTTWKPSKDFQVYHRGAGIWALEEGLLTNIRTQPPTHPAPKPASAV
nr:uncharacterized protein LOC132597639 [Globicephala melas]